MASNSLDDGVFEQGEAEQLAHSVRSHIRSANVLRAAGDAGNADAEEEKAKTICGVILRRLNRRLERYARATSSNEQIREDVMTQISVELWRRLSHPGKSYDACEYAFNQFFKHAALTAITAVKLENGLGRTSVTTVDMDEDHRDASAPLIDLVSDPLLNTLERLLGPDIAGQFFDTAPSELHVKIFGDKISGMTWDEIAARHGICDTTAKTKYDRARAYLKSLVPSGDQPVASVERI